MPEPTSPLNIFIIYARADADALAEFKKSLTPLVRRGEVAIWYDAEIIPGQEWEKAIEKKLKAADIIVLFLSSDFFNSHYIEKKELREALIRHRNGEVVVAPVVVRHCLWQEYPQIERLQVLPDNAIPVFSKKHWDGLDEAFTNVAAGIARVARAIVKKRQERIVEAMLEKAAAEYDRRNFEAAFLVFDQYKDNPLFLGEYQRRLGRMYDLGQFVSRDHQKAKIWYEKAAEKGDVSAMFNLGSLYYFTPGVRQDYQMAKIWYEKAAEKGFSDAMFNLGALYHSGKGVPQDYQMAKTWYEKAVQKGQVDAMNGLGILYRNGQGVPQDYQIAKNWYEKAAEKGFSDAMKNLGKLYEHGLGVPKDPKMAQHWYEKAKQQEKK